MRRLMSQAPAELQFAAIYGTTAEEDLANDHASDEVRGTLIFGQMDDNNVVLTAHEQVKAGTNMAMNQADGIANWGVGPEIRLTKFETLRIKAPEVLIVEHQAHSGVFVDPENVGCAEAEIVMLQHQASLDVLG